jgi:hypothetical protein
MPRVKLYCHDASLDARGVTQIIASEQEELMMDAEFIRRACEWLCSNRLPYSDEIILKASGREFAGGGHYGAEVPVVNSLQVLEATLGLLKKEGLPVTRSQGVGRGLACASTRRS